MALPLLIGGSILTGLAGARSADRAAGAQAATSREGIAEQRRQFDTITSLMAPQQALGQHATMQLGDLFFGQNRSLPGAPAQPVGIAPQPGMTSQINTRPSIGSGAQRFLPGRSPVTIDNSTGSVLGGQTTGQPITSTPVSYSPVPSGQPSSISSFFAPQQFSGNYSPSQFSSNYGPETFSFNPSATELSPATRRVLDESMRAIQNSAAGRGNVLSGETLRSLSDRAGDIASGEINNDFNRSLTTFNTNQAQKSDAFNRNLTTFGVNRGERSDAFNRSLTEFNVNRGQEGDFFNRLAALAGLGQTANTTVAGAAQNTGNNVASLLGNIGAARAGGIQGQNSALQGTAGNLGLLALLNQGGYFNG